MPKAKTEMKVLSETGVTLITESFLPAQPQPAAKPPLRYANLPLISCLPSADFQRAKSLLEEMDEVQSLKDMVLEREEEIKQELEQIQQRAPAAVRGLRWGQLCFAAEERDGRKTLSVDLLVEHGVDPRVIQASYKQGSKFMERTFRRLNDPNSKKTLEVE